MILFFNILDLLRQSWRWLQAFNGCFLQLVSLTFFLLVHLFTYFLWGMEFPIFQPLFHADSNANHMNRATMFHRHWVDKQGNPASYKILICFNQPLPAADGQDERGEE